MLAHLPVPACVDEVRERSAFAPVPDAKISDDSSTKQGPSFLQIRRADELGVFWSCIRAS